MLKKLWRNKKGTAEIIGTALFLVILFFFFSNVFLFHNRVSREMDQIVADKTNSAIQLVTGSGSGDLVNCMVTSPNTPQFGGFGSKQTSSTSPSSQNAGPPYGRIVSGSYTDTFGPVPDDNFQVLGETGKLETSDVAECLNTNLDYICLNATYQFNVGITTPEDLRLIRAITISFYGRSYETEGEAVDVFFTTCKEKLSKIQD